MLFYADGAAATRYNNKKIPVIKNTILIQLYSTAIKADTVLYSVGTYRYRSTPHYLNTYCTITQVPEPLPYFSLVPVTVLGMQPIPVPTAGSDVKGNFAGWISEPICIHLQNNEKYAKLSQSGKAFVAQSSEAH